MRSRSLNQHDSTRDFAFMDCQMMSVQSNVLGRRLDADLDLYDSLEGESTAKLEVEELDIIVDSFDADCVNTRPLAMKDRPYVSGKVLRSAAAMVLIDLRRIVFEGKDKLE